MPPLFLRLYCEVIMVPQPDSLILSVPPKNVPSWVSLKIPRGNQNDVSVSYPHPAFQLSSNPTQSLFAVLALYHYSVGTKHFHSYTEHIILRRQNHLVEFSFIRDFSFTHFLTPYVEAFSCTNNSSIRMVWRKSKARSADLTLPLKNSNRYLRLGSQLY